jgi:hypothetical protein
MDARFVNTNQIDVGGIPYTFTNAPGSATNYLVRLDPSTSNAAWVVYVPAAGGGGSPIDSRTVTNDVNFGGFSVSNALRYWTEESGSWAAWDTWGGNGMRFRYDAGLGLKTITFAFAQADWDGLEMIDIADPFDDTSAANWGFLKDNLVEEGEALSLSSGMYQDGSIATGKMDAAAHQLYSTRPRFPYLKIELNPGGSPGNWTDFEVKIFNVTNSVQVWDNSVLVYHYQTMGDPWDNPGSYGDTNAQVYFVDDYDAFPTETRGILKWSIYTNETAGIDVLSISDQLQSTDSVIDYAYIWPSTNCVIDWSTWQSFTNAQNLRASFVRFDSVGPEMNAASTKQRWNAVEIQWAYERKSERPSP